ncbi:hypothetical protein ACWKW9_11060 [Rhizobium daejeonense]
MLRQFPRIRLCLQALLLAHGEIEIRSVEDIALGAEPAPLSRVCAVRPKNDAASHKRFRNDLFPAAIAVAKEIAENQDCPLNLL